MEAIRIWIEAEYNREVRLDKLFVKKDNQSIPLKFKKQKLVKTGNEIIIEGMQPSKETMELIGMDTYKGITEIEKIERMRFIDNDGGLAPVKVKKVEILFPYRKQESIQLYPKK